MTVHYRDLVTRPVTAPLLRTCDRCGRDLGDQLHRDALGTYVCGPCFAGGSDQSITTKG